MEKFAAYGVELEIPDDWRIEFNAKNTRQRGDVALHSPKNNVFFVSWGKLEEAQRRFKSLEEHRDNSVKRIAKDPNIQKADVTKSMSQTVSGHRGLLTGIQAQRRRGLMGRQEPPQNVWSVHFYCPETSRYYVVYWQLKVGDEFPDPLTTFLSIVQSMQCHQGHPGSPSPVPA